MKAEQLELIYKRVFSFFSELSESEKTAILSNSRIKNYEKNSNVHSGSNDCLGVIVVLKGELRTYMLSDEGREVTLYRIKNDEVCILSASCLIKNITFDVYIDAVEDTEIALIDVSTFESIQRNNVYVENYALKLTVERFSDVMWAIEQIIFTSFDTRLATFLLDEAGSNNEINYTHEEIAKYIGSAREVVSRSLKRFEKAGILTMKRRDLIIKDKTKLKKLI